MPKCILTEQGGKGTGEGLTLIALAVTKPPDKKDYIAEEAFVPNGMVVTATYGVGETVIATGEVTGYQWEPKTLSDSDKFVKIIYSEMGSTQTAQTEVTVKHKPKTLRVSTNPQKTEYQYGESFDKKGMKVTVGYSDSTEEVKDENSITYTPTEPFTTLNQQTITVSYQESGYTVTCQYDNINVIKADNTIILNPESINIKDTNPQRLTVTRLGDGAITWEPEQVNGLTIIGGGDIITITGNGETPIEDQVLTIKVAEGQFYKPAQKDIHITASYWEWGSPDEVGNADWWLGLQKFIQTNDTQTIASTIAVGKKKKVTLTSAVQGTTTHNVMVIGVNQDGDKTVTFQTENCLKNTMTSGFSSNSALWIGSIARDTVCGSYYSNFPGKAAIKSVRKNTCTDQNGAQSSYNSENVFFLSAAEIGFPHSSWTYAPQVDEYTEGKSGAYSYYTNNTTRIKKDGDDGSTCWYWLRSRYSYGSSSVCIIYYDGAYSNTYYNDTGGRAAPAFVIG